MYQIKGSDYDRLFYKGVSPLMNELGLDILAHFLYDVFLFERSSSFLSQITVRKPPESN
jgi:hypothetical protein